MKQTLVQEASEIGKGWNLGYANFQGLEDELDQFDDEKEVT